jgi:hypothetical protein
VVGFVTLLTLINLALDGCYFYFHDARMIWDLSLKITSEELRLLDFYINATGLQKIVLQNQVQCPLANGIPALHVAMTLI